MKWTGMPMASAMTTFATLMGSSPAAAQAAAPARGIADVATSLVISVVFGVLGIGLLIAGYYVLELVTAYSVSKELVEEHNVAVGLVVAAVILGMAIIIAAAIL